MHKGDCNWNNHHLLLMISFGSEFTFAFFSNKMTTKQSQKLLCLLCIEATFGGVVKSSFTPLNCH